jgi:MerR family transcriptional regulator, redox-sensitive transcriptional activator SoxR
MSNPVKTEAFLTIGELSRRSGVPVSAIHFYESKNLVTSTRNNGNHRIFARRELRMLAVIKVAWIYA